MMHFSQAAGDLLVKCKRKKKRKKIKKKSLQETLQHSSRNVVLDWREARAASINAFLQRARKTLGSKFFWQFFLPSVFHQTWKSPCLLRINLFQPISSIHNCHIRHQKSKMYYSMPPSIVCFWHVECHSNRLNHL